jgi:hypothetical protein
LVAVGLLFACWKRVKMSKKKIKRRYLYSKQMKQYNLGSTYQVFTRLTNSSENGHSWIKFPFLEPALLVGLLL